MDNFEKLFDKKEKFALKIVRHFPKFITPNLLTLIRLLLLPLIIRLILIEENIWALVVFALAYLTDVFDGPIARYRKLSSKFGVMFDGFVDKVVFLTVLIVAGYKYLPPALIISLIILDLGVLIIAPIIKIFINKKKWRIELKANIYGKLKMFFEFTGVVILLFNPFSNVIILASTIFLFIGIIFSLISIILYISTITVAPDRRDK